MVKAKKGQTFLDIAIQQTGNVDNAFSIAFANHHSLTDVLQEDEEVIIPTGLEVVKNDSFFFSIEEVQVSKVKVLALQTFIDIAIQYTGNASNAYPIALANSRSITDTLTNGEFLVLPIDLIKSTKEVQYYVSKNIKPATGITIKKDLSIDYSFPLEFPISF
jgi:hypothetical protein